MPSGSSKSTRGQSVSSSNPRRVSGVGTEKTTDDRLDEIHSLLKTLITEEVLDRKLEKLKTDIQREHAERIEVLEDRVSELETENEDLRNTVFKLQDEIKASSDSEMASKLNDLEQQGRKNSIRIVGLADPGEKETVEECVRSIVGFVRESLKVSIQESDIDIAHRLGKYSSKRPRNVIVKFVRRRKQQEIINARRVLKKSGYVVYEDLTPYNQGKLKDAFNLDCVKNSFSVDGKLFVVLENGKKRRLQYDTPLEKDFLYNDANCLPRK